MKKMFFLMCIALLLVIPVSVSADPVEEMVPIDPLSQSEISYLLNKVGLSEDEVSYLPETMLRQMIDMEVVKVGSKTQNFSENPFTGELQPRLSGDDMTLQIVTTVQASDKTGYKKYNMWGYSFWKKSPQLRFTDKMTIGVPESVGFFLPVNGTSIDQFSSTYEYNINGTWYTGYTSKTPADWKANSGVASKLPLVTGTNYLHRGYISQNIYIANSKSGITNMTLEYGHATLSFEPSISISPSSGSIGITIRPDVEIYKIPYEFKY